jgi:hypothetical protein
MRDWGKMIPSTSQISKQVNSKPTASTSALADTSYTKSFTLTE